MDAAAPDGGIADDVVKPLAPTGVLDYVDMSAPSIDSTQKDFDAQVVSRVS
jgi:hypothetical protein